MNRTDHLSIHRIEKPDLPRIRQLALSIWPVTYGPILCADQITYMLERFYSEAALLGDFTQTGYHFFILQSDQEDMGYAGVEARDAGHWHLHKIYLSPKIQGKGLGLRLLRHVETFAQAGGARRLTLNVNRFNKALGFYKTCGYRVLSEADTDIGNGFYMNDYIMEKDLSP